MSEQILNQGSMYESIQGIQELNQVEGFDPRKYTVSYTHLTLPTN